jgi:hypothetical protein
MASSYGELVDLVDADIQQKSRAISGRFPMAGSEWLNKIRPICTETDDTGVSTVTLFSGGKFSLSNVQYLPSLRFLANDIEKGVLPTLNETPPVSMGSRVMFELDYRSLKRLPTEEEVKAHLLIIWNTVVKYIYDGRDDPINNADDEEDEDTSWLLGGISSASSSSTTSDSASMYDMLVARSDEKLKPQAKDPDHPKLAAGLHVIFNNLSVSPEVNARLAVAANVLIQRHCPIFQDVIDIASYRRTGVSLRMIYCHKMSYCDACQSNVKEQRKADRAKSQPALIESLSSFSGLDRALALHVWDDDDMDDLDEDDDDCPSLGISAIVTCGGGCVGGRVVEPAVYRPVYRYDGTDWHDDVIKKWSLYRQLVMYSIHKLTPTIVNGVTRPSVQLPQLLDHVPAGASTVFKGEATAMRALGKKMGAIKFTMASHFEALTAMEKIIFETAGLDVQVHSITKTGKNCFFVNLTGPNCRACPVNNGEEHQGNRIYMSLTRQKLRLNCFNTVCKRKLKQARSKKTDEQKKLGSDLGRLKALEWTVPKGLRTVFTMALGADGAVNGPPELIVPPVAPRSNENIIHVVQGDIDDEKVAEVEMMYDDQFGCMVPVPAVLQESKETLSVGVGDNDADDNDNDNNGNDNNNDDNRVEKPINGKDDMSDDDVDTAKTKKKTKKKKTKRRKKRKKPIVEDELTRKARRVGEFYASNIIVSDVSGHDAADRVARKQILHLHKYGPEYELPPPLPPPGVEVDAIEWFGKLGVSWHSWQDVSNTRYDEIMTLQNEIRDRRVSRRHAIVR